LPNNNDQSLRGLLNESTPVAPATPEEINERMHSFEPSQEQEHLKRQQHGPAQDLTPLVTNSTGLGVFVPISSEGMTQAGAQEVRYEVRSLSGGGPVLPIYTSEHLLSTTLGPQQGFAQIDIIELLQQIKGRVPLVVNPVLSEYVNSPSIQAAQDREDKK
jgi:hypothetical protein